MLCRSSTYRVQFRKCRHMKLSPSFWITLYNKNSGYFTWRQIYIFIIVRLFLLIIKNVSENLLRKSKQIVYVQYRYSSKIVTFKIKWGKKLGRTGHRWQLHAGNLRLKTYTQNMQYVLLLNCKNGCTNAPQFYVIRTLPVLLVIN